MFEFENIFQCIQNCLNFFKRSESVCAVWANICRKPGTRIKQGRVQYKYRKKNELNYTMYCIV